jgi:hypothetical protein
MPPTFLNIGVASSGSVQPLVSALNLGLISSEHELEGRERLVLGSYLFKLLLGGEADGANPFRGELLE